MDITHDVSNAVIRVDGSIEDISMYERFLGKPDIAGVSPFGDWTAYWSIK